MNKVICVYSSSSQSIDEVYFNAARELGSKIAKRGDTFLFGGGLTGLMGTCARAVHKNNGKVVGIIPKALNIKGVVYENCDELVETSSVRERKAKMDELSDSFIALPGGYGTLEELLEIITLKQLKYHNKPIVIINTNGFFDFLIKQFERTINENFAKKECRDLYYVTDNIDKAINYIDNYTPFNCSDRWLTDLDKQQ